MKDQVVQAELENEDSADLDAHADIMSREKELTHKNLGIAAGFDTLAETFGDVVYVHRRGNTMQMPCCGKWSVFNAAEMMSEDGPYYVRCTNCFHDIAVERSCNADWVGVSVSKLLDEYNELSNFHIPCMWNGKNNWISRKDLTEKYENFLKEKENV